MSMSIAHMNLEERLQQISLKVIDQVRILYELMKSEDNVTPMQVYSKINGIKNSVETDKFMLGEYIIRVKEGIQDKDLYIDVLNNLEKISQNLDAASYRLSVLISRGTQIDELMYKLITIIAEKLLASLMHLVESLRLLSVNAQKSVEAARNIIKLEEEVDDLYRSLELKLFEKKYDDLIYVMLMKDVADRLEDSEDMVRDSATSITYIAFGRI
ncbi:MULTISPECIES: phosphate transport regulator [Metallosphaera]|uniref:phosphate transport regulator n=1 Tax=Metallosphaera TaxID=41980 RepID=UPI001EDFC1CC|nr:phosphate transport regulator [Metallosphaera javensis (ex Hofmann et al. 2022)]